MIDKCLADCHSDVIESLEEFVIKDKSENRAIFSRLVIFNPQRLRLIEDDPKRIRRLWYSRLFLNDEDYFPILAFLFRNNMIPDEERSNALNHVINKIINQNYRFMPRDNSHEELKKLGFYNVFVKKIFNSRTSDHVGWYNAHDVLIKNLISKLEIDQEIVIILNEIFKKKYSPWALMNRIYDLFKEVPEIQEKIIYIANENSIELCEFLTRKPSNA